MKMGLIERIMSSDYDFVYGMDAVRLLRDGRIDAVQVKMMSDSFTSWVESDPDKAEVHTRTWHVYAPIEKRTSLHQELFGGGR